MLRKVFMLALAIGVLAGASARAAERATERAIDLLDVPVSYTADFMVRGDKGTYRGTVWHAPGRERRDFGTSGGGQSVLLRRDTDSAYLMKPSGRWYVGLAFQAVGALAGGIDALTVERRRIGEDKVGGVAAVRYQVTATGPKGARFDGDAWFTRDNIVVRAMGMLTEGNGKVSEVEMVLSELKVGRVDERMFELPAGWLGMDLRKVPADKIAQAVDGLKPLLERGQP